MLHQLFSYIIAPASAQHVEMALFFMRVGIGILTIGHGIPKIMGGVNEWRQLGTFMHPLGIYFWPLAWGFIGAATEFFGGIALTIGLGTRIASLFLILMMIVATVWHISRGDSYNQYSFPLSLIFVYAAFFIIGGGIYSVDYYLAQ